MDLNLSTCNVHGEMNTLRKLLSTYLRSNQNVGRKQIIGFRKTYQIGTLRIVAMEKREGSPTKKMFKSFIVCAYADKINDKQ